MMRFSIFSFADLSGSWDMTCHLEESCFHFCASVESHFIYIYCMIWVPNSFVLSCQIICKYHTWSLDVYSLEHLLRVSCQDFITINSLTLLLPFLPILIITISLEVLVWEFLSNSKSGVWCAPLFSNTFS
jgi:hypothetical protein